MPLTSVMSFLSNSWRSLSKHIRVQHTSNLIAMASTLSNLTNYMPFFLFLRFSIRVDCRNQLLPPVLWPLTRELAMLLAELHLRLPALSEVQVLTSGPKILDASELKST